MCEVPLVSSCVEEEATFLLPQPFKLRLKMISRIELRVNQSYLEPLTGELSQFLVDKSLRVDRERITDGRKYSIVLSASAKESTLARESCDRKLLPDGPPDMRNAQQRGTHTQPIEHPIANPML